jgi:hypothetical protein
VALEEERFGELGGSVHAKGFLRSYAGYLGIDPAPLVEAYRAQEPPEAPVFERAPRVVGGLRSGRRGPSWLAVAIIFVSIILLVSLWGLLRPAPDPAGAQPAFVTTPASTTGTGAAATPAARPAVRDAPVTVRYAGASPAAAGATRSPPGAGPWTRRGSALRWSSGCRSPARRRRA